MKNDAIIFKKAENNEEKRLQSQTRCDTILMFIDAGNAEWTVWPALSFANFGKNTNCEGIR